MSHKRIWRWTVICSLGPLVALLAVGRRVSAQDQSQKPPTASATPAQSSAGAAREVNLDALPQWTAAAQQGQAHELEEGIPFSPAQYKALKDTAFARSEAFRATSPVIGADKTTALPTGAIEPNTPGDSKNFFPTDTAEEFTPSCNSFIPSDMAVAANATYVVQVTNSCIFVDNTTTGVPFAGFPKGLNAFFGAPAGDAVGDPRALFDPQSARFVIVAEDFTANSLYVASSKTGVATGAYFIINIGMGIACGGGGDFPMIGQTLQENGDTKGALYVSWDEFCTSHVTNDVFALPKTHLYNGTAFGFSGFANLAFGPLVDHVQPVNVMNKGDRPRGEILINTFNFNFGGGACSTGCNGLVVWSFYNGIPAKGGLQSLNGISIATANNYFLAPGAPQPGCSSGLCLIDTGTPGITGMVNYSSGNLYATINAAISGVPGASILLWEVHPTLNDAGAITNATIENEVCMCSSFQSSYYGTIQPDSEGNYSMAFNFSDSGVFPSVGVLSNRTTQAAGGLHDFGFALAVGSTFYQQLDKFNRNRWGDYTGTAFSQTGLNAYWFSGQYSIGGGLWATGVGKNGYTSLTQP